MTEGAPPPDALFGAAFDAAPNGMALLDLAGRWFAVNAALGRMLGAEPAELRTSFGPVVADEVELAQAEVAARELAQGASAVTLDQRYRHRDGHVVWLRRRTSLVRDGAGLPEYVVATFEDIGARRSEDARLIHLALHDPLTGLANRALLDDRLDQAIGRRDREGGVVAVLFADVDGLKELNDRHGHAFGDQVLVAVAERLVAQVRGGDTVARFGGDEFVMVANLRSPRAAAGMIARLSTALNSAPPLLAPDGTPVTVQVSVGQGVSADENANPAQLLGLADQAMYNAKRRR